MTHPSQALACSSITAAKYESLARAMLALNNEKIDILAISSCCARLVDSHARASINIAKISTELCLLQGELIKKSMSETTSSGKSNN